MGGAAAKVAKLSLPFPFPCACDSAVATSGPQSHLSIAGPADLRRLPWSALARLLSCPHSRGPIAARSFSGWCMHACHGEPLCVDRGAQGLQRAGEESACVVRVVAKISAWIRRPGPARGLGWCLCRAEQTEAAQRAEMPVADLEIKWRVCTL